MFQVDGKVNGDEWQIKQTARVSRVSDTTNSPSSTTRPSLSHLHPCIPFKMSIYTGECEYLQGGGYIAGLLRRCTRDTNASTWRAVAMAQRTARTYYQESRGVRQGFHILSSESTKFSSGMILVFATGIVPSHGIEICTVLTSR